MTEETKHDKFVRLSTARMGKVEHAMKQLEYLGSPNYEFSEEEANAIITTLDIWTMDIAVALGVVSVITEPEPEPEPEPVTELEETLKLFRIAPQIDAAINEISDETQKAPKQSFWI